MRIDKNAKSNIAFRIYNRNKSDNFDSHEMSGFYSLLDKSSSPIIIIRNAGRILCVDTPAHPFHGVKSIKDSDGSLINCAIVALCI